MKHLVSLVSSYEKDLFVIKWRITRLCNLHCSYCVQVKNRTQFSQAAVQKETETLLKAAPDISAMMDRLSMKKVKLEFVGGEMSLFDLKKILSLITSKKLKRVQLTTNFTRNEEYYISLAHYLRQRNIELTITCSFHYEFMSMDTYFSKALAVKSSCTIFACEMVSNEDNQVLCKEFRKRCEELKLDYSIDEDIRMEKAGLRKEGKLLGCGQHIKKNPRYIAVFSEEGKEYETVYKTRNDFVTDGSFFENFRNKIIKTNGFICTQSWDYVYIEVDNAIGRTKTSKDCCNRMKIADFVQIPPCECIKNGCTLCGQMSLLPKKQGVSVN